MAEPRVFTLAQVSKNRSKKDCWFVINGRVLDVTKFLEEHPAGKDATKKFENIGHSNAAKSLLFKYSSPSLQDPRYRQGCSIQGIQNKEMRAFVIKDDLCFSGVLCASPGGEFLFLVQIP